MGRKPAIINLLVGVVLVANGFWLFTRQPEVAGVLSHGLKITPAVIDVGVVPVGEKETFSVLLENDGNQTITKLRMTPSCGCAVLDVDEQTLDPGEATVLRGQYDSTRRRGPVRVNVLIEFETEGKIHRQLLQVTGAVKQRVGAV